jgi:hypothetical protein
VSQWYLGASRGHQRRHRCTKLAVPGSTAGPAAGLAIGVCTLCAFSLGRAAVAAAPVIVFLPGCPSCGVPWSTGRMFRQEIGMRSNHRRRAVLDLSQSNCDSRASLTNNSLALSSTAEPFGGQPGDDASLQHLQLGLAGLLLSSEPALPVCRFATSMLCIAWVVRKHESSLAQSPSIMGSRVQSMCPFTLLS